MDNRQCPEASLDNLAAVGAASKLALRSFRLRERAKCASSHERADMLHLMANAYLSRGMAVEHRLAGSVATALRLEAQSEDLLAAARWGALNACEI